MSPVSPVFHNEVTVSIGLKTNLRLGTSKIFFNLGKIRVSIFIGTWLICTSVTFPLLLGHFRLAYSRFSKSSAIECFGLIWWLCIVTIFSKIFAEYFWKCKYNLSVKMLVLDWWVREDCFNQKNVLKLSFLHRDQSFFDTNVAWQQTNAKHL